MGIDLDGKAIAAAAVALAEGSITAQRKVRTLAAPALYASTRSAVA